VTWPKEVARKYMAGKCRYCGEDENGKRLCTSDKVVPPVLCSQAFGEVARKVVGRDHVLQGDVRAVGGRSLQAAALGP
jgi:hypothetical protein